MKYLKRSIVGLCLVLSAPMLLPSTAQAAAFNVTASDSYFTFAGNVSGSSDIRLLSDKATAIGFEGLDTISFLQFDLGELQTPEVQSKFEQATLQLTYDPVLTEPANLIPATGNRPVTVSVYDLTAPFDSADGNTTADIDFGAAGENAIASTSVGDGGTYTWDITSLVSQWLTGAELNTDLALSGVFGNVDIDGRNSYASFFPAGATAGLAPTITVKTVPEPNSLAALLLLGGGLAIAKKRQPQSS